MNKQNKLQISEALAQDLLDVAKNLTPGYVFISELEEELLSLLGGSSLELELCKKSKNAAISLGDLIEILRTVGAETLREAPHFKGGDIPEDKREYYKSVNTYI